MLYEQRKIIGGKPYFGIWYGRCIIINQLLNCPYIENPVVKSSINKLKQIPIPPECEIRNDTIIFREPLSVFGLNMNATVGYKFILWGRSFRVMNCLKKGKKRTKKVYLNGKRKRVRIDR